jgi:hypothetical protein
MDISLCHEYEDVNQFAVPLGSSHLKIEEDLNRLAGSSNVHSEGEF